MNLSSSKSAASTEAKTAAMKANTSLSAIKLSNTPDLKHFFATHVDKSVWWHTEQRKVNGKYTSNPKKKWRPKKKTVANATPRLKHPEKSLETYG